MPKMDALKEFLSPNVENLIHTQIDLDITNLTLSDVMRNINHTYPKSTIERERISDGRTVLAVLCKSEFLFPLKGILLMIISDTVDVNIVSQKYAVVCVNEHDISSETKIMNVNDRICVYLAKNYREIVDDFDMFYNRFLYNAYEAEVN